MANLRAGGGCAPARARSRARALPRAARTLAGETDYRIDRQAGATAARTARLAIEGLDDDAPGPAACLTALEASVLAFAAIAIRGAENIAAANRGSRHHVQARRSQKRRPSFAEIQLHASFAEIHAHAQTLLKSGYRSDAGGLLSECLVIASSSSTCDVDTAAFVSPAAAGQNDESDHDHRRWLRLGARELLLCRVLAALPGCGPGPEPAEIVEAAARILVDPGPATRVSTSGVPLAWANQASALSGLVPECARALRGDIDAAHVAYRTLTDRLVRVVIMFWLVGSSSAS